MATAPQTDNMKQDTSATGCRVPYRVFTDRQYYEREQENIFKGECWSFVGLEAEVPQAGDFKSTFVGETPVILTRELWEFGWGARHSTGQQEYYTRDIFGHGNEAAGYGMDIPLL